jgi:hypothetical protein
MAKADILGALACSTQEYFRRGGVW